MRLPYPFLRRSPTRYRSAVADGLDQAFNARSAQAGALPLESAQIIVFSDLHRGARDGADDFWRCERAYSAALAYYLEAGHHLYLLGDAEELWENRPAPVLAEHEQTLALEAKFHAKERYVRFWGNHDELWNDSNEVEDHLQKIFDQGLPEPRTLHVREALRLPVTSGGEERGVLFFVHGHQGTFFSDSASPFAQWVVRNVWRNIQRVTRRPSTTPAGDWKLREQHDRAMAKWAGDSSGERVVLIAGHTHRPVFGTELSIREIEVQLGAGTPPGSTGRLRARLEYLRAWSRWRDPHPQDSAPCYFNTGCCSFGDGDITGLEIAGGNIRLVRWPERWPDDQEPLPKVLATADLSEVFARVAGTTP